TGRVKWRVSGERGTPPSASVERGLNARKMAPEKPAYPKEEQELRTAPPSLPPGPSKTTPFSEYWYPRRLARPKPQGAGASSKLMNVPPQGTSMPPGSGGVMVRGAIDVG